MIPSRYTTQIELLDSVAFTAVEHQDSLDLLRLVTLIDLYARYLETNDEGGREPASFEDFVRDPALLAHAADLATSAGEDPIVRPEPLGR